MPVEVLAGMAVAHGGAGVSVAGGDLYVAQVESGVQHRSDEGVPEHVRGCMRGSFTPASSTRRRNRRVRSVDPFGCREGSRRSVGVPIVDGSLDCAAHGGWKRDEDDPVALAVNPEHSVAVFLTKVLNSLPVASKMRSPSNPSMVTSAKSHRLGECFAAVSSASNCRWVSPSVGDSTGTLGRRTYSDGESGSGVTAS